MSGTNQTKSAAFSPTTMIALVLVGIIAVAALVLLSVYGPKLNASFQDGGTHIRSKSSVGFYALQHFLEPKGSFSKTTQSYEGTDLPKDDVLIVTPTFEHTQEELRAIRYYGPKLFILPKWQTSPTAFRRGWVELGTTLPLTETFNILPSDLRVDLTPQEGNSNVKPKLLFRPNARVPFQSLGQFPEVKELRTFVSPNWDGIITDQNGGIILGKHRIANVYLLADPDFFNNGGLSSLQNAKLADLFFQAITPKAGSIRFDLSLYATKLGPDLMKLVLEPPLLGATLCFLFALVLIGLNAAVRFQPAMQRQRAVALGKKALADNTAGLVRMAKREHSMAHPFALLTKRLAARSVGAPANLDPVPLSALLDRIGEMYGSKLKFTELESSAAAAGTISELMKTAQDLYRWKQETTREHK